MTQKEENLQNDTLSLLSQNVKEYLDRELPLTQFPKDEKTLLISMIKNTPRNMFLQAIRDGELEIALKLIYYKIINILSLILNVYKYDKNTTVNCCVYLNENIYLSENVNNFNGICDGYNNGIIHYCASFGRVNLLQCFFELKKAV